MSKKKSNHHSKKSKTGNRNAKSSSNVSKKNGGNLSDKPSSAISDKPPTSIFKISQDVSDETFQLAYKKPITTSSITERTIHKKPVEAFYDRATETTYKRRSVAADRDRTATRRKSEPSRQEWKVWLTKLAIQAGFVLLFYFIVYIVITEYAGEAYDFSYQIFGNVSMEDSSDDKVKVTIPEGAALDEVASLLAEKELIKNEYSFYIREKLSTSEKRMILPGTYILHPSDSYEEILNILTQDEDA